MYDTSESLKCHSGTIWLCEHTCDTTKRIAELLQTSCTFNSFTNYNCKNKWHEFIPAVKTFCFLKSSKQGFLQHLYYHKIIGVKRTFIRHLVSFSKAGKHYMEFFEHWHNLSLKLPPASISEHPPCQWFIIFTTSCCFPCLIQALPVGV